MSMSIPLVWGPHQRDGQERTEWHAPECPCGFQYWDGEPLYEAASVGGEAHIVGKVSPHWHPCERHAPKVEAEQAQADRPVVTAPKGLIWGWSEARQAHLYEIDQPRLPYHDCGLRYFPTNFAFQVGGVGVRPCAKCAKRAARMEAKG